MCGTSASADRLLVVHEARVAADELVERFLRLPVAKAMNLGTRAGFDRAVALLAAQLRRATGRADVDAVREAIAVLDVDWARTTAAERRRLVAEAIAAAGRATAIVPARIEAPFNDAAQEVVAAIQSLDQAYRDYYAAVADYNRAQFRLYRAMGDPGQNLLLGKPTNECHSPPATPEDLLPPRRLPPNESR